MRKEEIVNEIRKRCKKVKFLPSIGWHFVYNERHYICINGKDNGMIRFSVPHLIKADDYDVELLSEAINDTNRGVKYVKVVKLNNGSISLNYDHKITTDETVDIIVPHIINTLDFAATYLQNKLNSSGN